MQGTQSEGFRVHAPTQCHTLVCCAPVHRISPLKETGDLGVSGASLLVQVVFPRVLGVRVIQTRSVQKGVFPLAHVSSLFTLICGGCGAVPGLDFSSHCCVLMSCPLGSSR